MGGEKVGGEDFVATSVTHQGEVWTPEGERLREKLTEEEMKRMGGEKVVEEVGIIEGLPVDVSSEEVRALAEKQAEHHEKKATAYREQMESLRQLEAAEQPGRGSMNAARDLSGKAAEHRGKAEHLRFLAEHLVKGATYRLQGKDLVLLGVREVRW